MSSYHRNQAEMAHAATIQNGISIANSFFANREADRQQTARAIRYQVALENAQKTGVFPERLQRMVYEDWEGEQAALVTVLLRELKKLAPTHPLIVSEKCRDTVKKVSIINYCRAGRPIVRDFRRYVPSEASAQKIFAAYSKETA
ncbi:MAG: hypothetical protein ACXWJZ_17120 [Burkholderiaceae bacterium]